MVGFDEKKERLTGFEYSLAGAIAGAVTRFLGQPFDVLKTRFQLQVEPLSRHSKTSKYSNLFQATGVILSEEGIQGLWKGHLSGQYLSITFGLVQLDARSPQMHAVCGAFAGSVATVASFPFDVLRTRFIAQGKEKLYFTIHQGIYEMVKKEGPFSLFKGLVPTVLLTGPQAGAIFAFHNMFTSLYQKIEEYLASKWHTNHFLSSFPDMQVKWIAMKLLHRLEDPRTAKELDIVGNLVVGCLAGIFGKTFVYPLDLSRKRMQLQGFQGRKGFGENFTCRGLLSCLILTMQREGAKGLFKGLSPSILKAAVTTGLHFTTYEEMCKFLARRKS